MCKQLKTQREKKQVQKKRSSTYRILMPHGKIHGQKMCREGLRQSCFPCFSLLSGLSEMTDSLRALIFKQKLSKIERQWFLRLWNKKPQPHKLNWVSFEAKQQCVRLQISGCKDAMNPSHPYVREAAKQGTDRITRTREMHEIVQHTQGHDK